MVPVTKLQYGYTDEKVWLANHHGNAGKTTEEPVEDFGKVADKAWETFRKKPGTLEVILSSRREVQTIREPHRRALLVKHPR